MSIPSQPLRGLAAQGMSGNRGPFPAFDRTFPAAASAYQWVVTVPGLYEIAAWGCGSVSNGSVNGTGALAVKRVMLGAGQVVSIQVGLNGANVVPGVSVSGTATDTVVTFPNGTTMTAGSAAAGGSPGSASGGDVNIAGTAGTTSAVAGPSYTSSARSYTGGQVSGNKGATPGGATGNAVTTYGSDGLVIVTRIA